MTLAAGCVPGTARRLLLLYSGAGGVQTAKASRKQSSLSGKESAQGCIPKWLLGRPDDPSQERTGESGAFGLWPHPRGSSRISS